MVIYMTNKKTADNKPAVSMFIYLVANMQFQFSLHLFDNLHNFFNAWHIAACHNFAVDNKRR